MHEVSKTVPFQIWFK